VNTLSSVVFQGLLFVFYRVLHTFSLWPSFRKRLREKDFILVVRTLDGKIERTYHIQSGHIRSGKINSTQKKNAEPDLQITLETAKTCFEMILPSPENLLEPPLISGAGRFMQAIVEGSVSIEGDTVLVIWFMGILGDLLQMLRVEAIYSLFCAGYRKK